MRRSFLVGVLLITFCVHVFTLAKAADAKKRLPLNDGETFVIPSPILKIAMLEFQGIASDVLFIEAMVFIGETQQRKETPRVKAWEWNWLNKILDVATDLDPYFFDPYYYANAFLPWDAGMVKETNKLLAKGSQHRDWDWMLPFFIGFNDFYFMQNDSEAAEYLMEASRRPGGDPLLASIASRLAFKENRTKTAIYFLEETAKYTEDSNLKDRFETRIKALQSIENLDSSVTLFTKKFKRVPSSIDELVTKNIINQLPHDPYGGTYYIANDGKVRTTTSSELEPYLSPIQQKLRQ
jgi:hypothetical protein